MVLPLKESAPAAPVADEEPYKFLASPFPPSQAGRLMGTSQVYSNGKGRDLCYSNGHKSSVLNNKLIKRYSSLRKTSPFYG